MQRRRDSGIPDPDEITDHEITASPLGSPITIIAIITLPITTPTIPIVPSSLSSNGGGPSSHGNHGDLPEGAAQSLSPFPRTRQENSPTPPDWRLD